MIFSSLRTSRLKNRCLKGDGPAFLTSYYEQESRAALPTDPVSSLRFFIFDTETTGLNIRKDKVVSVGGVVVQEGMIHLDQSMEMVIQTTADRNEQAVIVHGLTTEEIVNGVGSCEAVRYFLDFLGPSVIVAHHANFDVSMMRKMIREETRGFDFYNPVVDTITMARKLLFPDIRPEHVNPRKLTLDSLVEHYEIANPDRHTAWGDALITAKLFLIMLKEFGRRGPLTLKDLQ